MKKYCGLNAVASVALCAVFSVIPVQTQSCKLTSFIAS